MKWWQLYFLGTQLRVAPSMSFSSGWTGGTGGGGLNGTVDSMSCATSMNRATCRVTYSATGGTAHYLYHADCFDGQSAFMDAEL